VQYAAMFYLLNMVQNNVP